MEIYTKEKLYSNKRIILNRIKKGAVFIHPTDTIYGIGCDATNFKSVKKIYDIKERKDMPFSVIAPSKEWIIKNCEVEDSLIKAWFNKLPGAYTLILRLKNKKCIAENVNLGRTTLGVRMPDNWFSEIVKELGFPIVTTSVNKSGKEFMTCLEYLDPDIKKEIDFIIYEGKKENRPSNLINLSQGSLLIEER